MKKLFAAAMGLAVLGLMSMGVMAAGEVVDLGAVTFVNPAGSDGIGADGTLYGTRYNVADYQQGSQSATVTIPAKAVLPCYLELNFKGNGANATLKSFGPGADPTWDGNMGVGTVSIDFLPPVSGFVDSKWVQKTNPSGAPATNAQIAPGDDVFIPSCDIFRSQIWSNLDYNYSVKSAGLNLTGDKSYGAGVATNLPIKMRKQVFVDGGALVNAADAAIGNFDLTNTEAIDITGGVELTGATASGHNVLKTTTVFQQFRVAYDKSHPAGVYTGSIEFKAWTI